MALKSHSILQWTGCNPEKGGGMVTYCQRLNWVQLQVSYLSGQSDSHHTNGNGNTGPRQLGSLAWCHLPPHPQLLTHYSPLLFLSLYWDSPLVSLVGKQGFGSYGPRGRKVTFVGTEL